MPWIGGGQRDIVLEAEPTGLTNAIAQNDVLLLPGAFVIRSVGISDVRDHSQCCLGFGNDSDFSYILIPILTPGRDGRGWCEVGPLLNVLLRY